MPEAARRAVLPALWQAAWRSRDRTLLAIGLLILAKVAAVLVPLMLKAIVDRFSDPSNFGVPVSTQLEAIAGGAATLLVLPVFLLVAYALLRFANTLFTELRDLVFARVAQGTVASFAEQAFQKLLELGPRFHTRRSTGALIRNVERGTAGIGFLLGAGLFTLLPTLVEFGAILFVLAVSYDLRFTLIVLATFVVYAVHTMIFSGRREVHQRRVNEMDSRATGRLVDCLINYESIRNHAREDFERGRYGEMMGKWVDDSVDNQRALSTLHIGQSAIIACGVAAVMLLAGEQTVRGTMTVGDLVLVNAYVIQICLPLNALGFVFRQARDAMVNTEELLQLLSEPPDIVDDPGAPPLQVAGGTVTFERVDFAYEPGRQILWDVSLTIPAGQTLAVVGGSGSGKSTLARLLLRSYDTGSGRVTIDGQDVRTVRLQSLREAIGVVPQDTTLFNDTIAFNIGYGGNAGGNASAGMADIVAAAQAAQVHEFITSLPEQYDTVVGERGVKLSGGEKQRIAIARAFLKNPPIMVFDEATSALDTRAERAIQGELDRIARGRTTLVIAHRLSTIVDADQIVVLDHGKVVERGRHDELLARDGLYAQLWNLQRQQQAVEQLEGRLARQPVNLAVLLTEAVDGLRDLIDAQQVRLYTSLDLENARVTGDPGMLAQSLREVIVRAIEATPRGGRMELRLERNGPHAGVRITDGRHTVTAPKPSAARGERTGATRATSAAPVAARPYGIDTPLDPLELRAALERAGGRFHIEPPTSTHGMSYVIELPLRVVDDVPPDAAAGQIEMPGAPDPETAPLRELQIVYVDDEADARETLQHLLEAYGADVTTFDSGAAALGWFGAHELPAWPQVLVSDIALGVEDGYSVMRRLRQLEAERGVPLDRRVAAIALTGLAQEADRIQSLMAGYQVHMAKPVDPSELVAGIRELVGRDES